MNNGKAIVVAAVVLAAALVLSAWFGAQGQIVSAYVAAHAEFGNKDDENGPSPVPEPSSFAPLVGYDF